MPGAGLEPARRQAPRDFKSLSITFGRLWCSRGGLFLKVGNRVGNARIIQKKKGLRFSLSPCFSSGSGEWIRTTDLRVMSPTSYRTAPPRDNLLNIRQCVPAVKAVPSHSPLSRLREQYQLIASCIDGRPRCRRSNPHPPEERRATAAGSCVRGRRGRMSHAPMAWGRHSLRIVLARADVADVHVLAAGGACRPKPLG